MSEQAASVSNAQFALPSFDRRKRSANSSLAVRHTHQLGGDAQSFLNFKSQLIHLCSRIGGSEHIQEENLEHKLFSNNSNFKRCIPDIQALPSKVTELHPRELHPAEQAATLFSIHSPIPRPALKTTTTPPPPSPTLRPFSSSTSALQPNIMVLSRFARLCVALTAISCLSASPTVNAGAIDDSPSPSPPGIGSNSSAKLPIFYFHGTNGNAENSVNYRTNLTAEGRSVVALDFCSDKCSSSTGLNKQVEMGVGQVRSIVAANPTVYENGYIFIAHSQGGTIAKFVIQEMDDHKVKTFVSLAASANGRFYGPQPEDAIPTKGAIDLIGAQVPQTVFNASAYTADPNSFKGKFQRDLLAAIFANPDLQASIPQFNQARSPFAKPWEEVNTVIPVYNNLVACGTNSTCLANQKRYKDNFVRVENIHLFASPNDSTQAPYQTGLYGFYSSVNSLEEVETKFEDLVVLDMTETREYVEDLYGLKTLNEAGRLHRHSVPNVDHNCWNRNSTDNGWMCTWAPVYAEHIYPLL